MAGGVGLPKNGAGAGDKAKVSVGKKPESCVSAGDDGGAAGCGRPDGDRVIGNSKRVGRRVDGKKVERESVACRRPCLVWIGGKKG